MRTDNNLCSVCPSEFLPARTDSFGDDCTWTEVHRMRKKMAPRCLQTYCHYFRSSHEDSTVAKND